MRRAVPLFVALFCVSSSTAEAVGLCRRLLWAAGIVRTLEAPVVSVDGVTLCIASDGNGVLCNGIYVSVPEEFPLSVIQHQLGLAPEEKPAVLPGKTLTIGDAMGPLFPALAEAGNDIHGLDLWYHNEHYPSVRGGAQMKAFVEKYAARLTRGTALRLPMADESFETVLSGGMVHNRKHDGSHDPHGMTREQQLAALDEAIRVTKVGGTIRFYGFAQDDAEAHVAALQAHYGEALSLEALLREVRYVHIYDGRITSRGRLLVIGKKDHTTPPRLR